MAKLSRIVKNNKIKKLVEKYKEKRDLLKKEGNYDALSKLPRNSSPIRYRNRCFICGRSRGYFRKFGLCRICLREQIRLRRLPGIKKVD